MDARRVGRRSISFTAAIAALMLVATSASGGEVAAKSGARKVTAEYSIGFNGMGIGTFKLWSDLNNTEYSLKGRATISVLAGILFEWRGDTASSGQVMAKLPRPYAYSFGYRTSDRGENINIRFANNIVEEIAVTPPQRQAPGRVPIMRKHMQNVVDPLSALVMLTNIGSNHTGSEVCSRRIPIFDGKARYDLKLTYKATKPVTTPYGYTGPAYVCKVKFLPIAGHRRGDDENDFAAKNEGMELWMVPLAQADLYVPYYIYVPTPVGSATLTSSSIEVETSREAGSALIR
ncbi:MULTISPECIES: DUF3108 domain-containing protein [Rhodomicrobium]|uniref:DUF3108 domain-containing protein n=1 Tax=Rhodomicrobium TaxID=1068 RepID=UPI000B4BAE7C|nr:MULTISPECIES: DUF3108 domain-containing protein [Rhodomicrobium]